MPEGALTPFTMWRISLLCGPGIVNDVTKVGHAQNIYYQRIVLLCLIHTLSLRKNLILLAIFNTIFFKLVVAYFFGPPCMPHCYFWKTRNNDWRAAVCAWRACSFPTFADTTAYCLAAKSCTGVSDLSVWCANCVQVRRHYPRRREQDNGSEKY